MSVASLCRAPGDIHPHADADLLLAGALSMIYSADVRSTINANEYTDAGRMIGHVVLGERRVRAAVDSSLVTASRTRRRHGCHT